MHLQPVFTAYPVFVDGTSKGLFNNSLCLPSGQVYLRMIGSWYRTEYAKFYNR
jgi:hypothetical protein